MQLKNTTDWQASEVKFNFINKVNTAVLFH